MDLNKYIRDIADFPKPGILFKDITPLLAAPEAFRVAVDRMADYSRQRGVSSVAAAEARGFLFAAPLAYLLNVPFIMLRKPGKLPYQTVSHKYELEYGTAELHMHIDSVQANDRVLLVDDVLATGGTMRAACQLVEQAGGHVAGCAFLLELEFLHGRKRLEPHEVFSLLRYT
jgi:adenine phosphoribosyltransferase